MDNPDDEVNCIHDRILKNATTHNSQRTDDHTDFVSSLKSVSSMDMKHGVNHNDKYYGRGDIYYY